MDVEPRLQAIVAPRTNSTGIMKPVDWNEHGRRALQFYHYRCQRTASIGTSIWLSYFRAVTSDCRSVPSQRAGFFGNRLPSTSARARRLDQAAHPSHCLCVLDCAEGARPRVAVPFWLHTVLLKILKRTSHTLRTPVGSRRL